MEKSNFIHFKPEEVYVPTSPESREVEGKKELEFVIDGKGNILKISDPRDVQEWLEMEKKKNPELIITPENGGVIVPGMTDAHHHLMYGTLDVIEAGYVYGLNSKKQIVESITKQVKGWDPKKPKLFLGHNTAEIPDIFRKDLDVASPDIPICLADLSFHGIRLNSKMFQLVSEAVEKERRAGNIMSGKLDSQTGQATEGHAVFVMQVVEAYHDIEKISEGMTNKLDEWIGQGVTNIHEMFPLSWNDLVATLITKKNWEKSRKMEFPVRQIFMTPEILKKLERDQRQLEKSGLFDPNKDWNMIGLKLITDGSFGSHTAMMEKPFSDQGGHGTEFHSVKDLNSAIAMIKEFGITRVAQHAIGDAAVKRALETAEKWVRLADSAKLDPTRFRIEHFELPTGSLDKAKELGVWTCSQPNFLTDMIYQDRLSGRVLQICPHADIIEKGIPMHFGSDGMPTSALFGIYAATHHPNPKQRISFEQALAAYSMTAAEYEYNTGRGRIAEGGSADIIVLKREVVDEMLKEGEASKEDFALLGKDNEALTDKISELESGIAKIYQQGRLIKEK